MPAVLDPDTGPPPLPAALADFVQSGVSITVAACGERRVPSIAKAVGCRVADDRRTVTLLLFATPSQPVLDDLRRHPSVAVCFSRPSTHQTVQLKGTGVRIAPTDSDDEAWARTCLDKLFADLQPLGFSQRMVHTLFWHAGDTLLSLSFQPQDAFAQTPGPGAGAAIAR